MRPGSSRGVPADAAAAPYLSLTGFGLALMAAVLLCWPMLVTTAPLVYFDTLSYFTNGEQIWHTALAMLGAAPDSSLSAGAADTSGAPATDQAAGTGAITIRSLAYAAWFYPLSLSPIGTVLACICQGALTLWVFLGLVPPLDTQARRTALVGFAAVAGLSTLPWFVSYAMPDILGAVLAAYFALALARADLLGRGQRLVLMGIAAFAILAHYGHLPVALVLALGALAWRWRCGRLTRGAALFCLAPVIAAFAVNFAASLALAAVLAPAAQTGAAPASAAVSAAASPPGGTASPPPAVRPSFAPGRLPVLLARSMEDGPARWYLKEECRQGADYAVCEVFGGALPDSVWGILWAPDGLRTATPEQMARIRQEETSIVLAAARRYPLEQAGALVRNTAWQSVLVGTGELLPAPVAVRSGAAVVAWPSNREAEADKVLPVFDWITPIFTALCFLLLAWRLATRRTEHRLAEAALMILFALLVNAAVYGGLSIPVDRYQSRVAWLIPALLALDVAVRRNRAPVTRR